MLERLAIDRGAILFDPRRVAAPGTQLFEADHWRAQGALRELAGGRGSILLIEGKSRSWVLRRYLRGGLAARFARDRYLWLGEERTRSFRELRLLALLHSRGLPVPAPVAGRYRRAALTYRAELITERLPGARSLETVIAAGEMDDALWAAVGRCLRHFHDAGVQHADLNARNIMVGARREVWVLDFDRGRLRKPGVWSGRVLDRLARSLENTEAAVGDWKAGFELLRLAHDA
ncbi:MAG TPA: 3-deoxy-D-manno-octulosonic acid kinase [Steroidobacteraceae bacterium]|nr:3-deoxy-D-manno-octulosonic acid kinase [Steroidobacteraceae bacterium]